MNENVERDNAAHEAADAYASHDQTRRADFIAGFIAGHMQKTRELFQAAQATVQPIIESERKSEIVGVDVMDRTL